VTDFTGKPITDEDKDVLRREQFVATLVAEIEKNTQGVIGLAGPWGEGKTSVINMAKAKLMVDKADIKPHIIEFDPWLCTGTGDIADAFFNQLIEELEDNSKAFGFCFRKILPTIVKWTVLISAFFSSQLLPWLVSCWPTLTIVIPLLYVLMKLTRSEYHQLIKAFKKYDTLVEKMSLNVSAVRFDFKTLWPQPSLAKQRKKVETALAGLTDNRRLIVLLDDADRLPPQQAMAVMQLLKQMEHMPNLLWVLAYDEHALVERLEKADCPNAAVFIQRLINVPLRLPEIDAEALTTWLYNHLFSDSDIDNTKLCYQLDNKPIDKATLTAWVTPFIPNLRAAKALKNAVVTQYDLVGQQIHYLDFVTMEAIRLQEPAVFKALRDENDLSPLAWRGSSDKEFKAFLYRQETQNILNETHRLIAMTTWDVADEKRTEKRKQIEKASLVIFDLFSNSTGKQPKQEALQRLADGFDQDVLIRKPLANSSLWRQYLLLGKINQKLAPLIDQLHEQLVEAQGADAIAETIAKPLRDWASKNKPEEKSQAEDWLFQVGVLFNKVPQDLTLKQAVGKNLLLQADSFFKQDTCYYWDQAPQKAFDNLVNQLFLTEDTIAYDKLAKIGFETLKDETIGNYSRFRLIELIRYSILAFNRSFDPSIESQILDFNNFIQNDIIPYIKGKWQDFEILLNSPFDCVTTASWFYFQVNARDAQPRRLMLFPKNSPGAEGNADGSFTFNININNENYPMPCDQEVDITFHPRRDAIWDGFQFYRHLPQQERNAIIDFTEIINISNRILTRVRANNITAQLTQFKKWSQHVFQEIDSTLELYLRPDYNSLLKFFFTQEGLDFAAKWPDVEAALTTLDEATQTFWQTRHPEWLEWQQQNDPQPQNETH
jgi:hypothetical protein